MKTILFVALGGALGASGRYAVGILTLHISGNNFQWGTIFVNVVGSFCLGIIVAAMTFAWSPSPEMRSFLIVGLLGGFTTFSAFSLETVVLLEKGHLELALIYIVGTVLLSIAGLIAGLKLSRIILA